MSNYCVIVADGARARFFTLEPVDVPELESGPNLVERSDLINPEAESQGQELWSNVKAGRNRSAGGGAHSYDDHRTQHEAEFLVRFARLIAEETGRMAGQNKVKHVVIAAEKAMLGFIREALASGGPKNTEVRELAKNLSKQATLEIHQHLSDAGLVPKRRKPGE